MNGFSAPTVEVRGLGQIMEQRPMYDSSRIITKSLHQKRLLDAYHLLQTDHSVQVYNLSFSQPAVIAKIKRNQLFLTA